MWGRAGSMASIARAFSAIITAIRQTNSAKPGPLRFGPLAGSDGWVVIAAEGGLFIGPRCGLRQADATLRG